MARREIAEFEGADGKAPERHHPAADGGGHPADLALLPLAERKEVAALRVLRFRIPRFVCRTWRYRSG